MTTTPIKKLFFIVSGSYRLMDGYSNPPLSDMGFLQASKLGESLSEILNNGDIVKVCLSEKLRSMQMMETMIEDCKRSIEICISKQPSQFSTACHELDQLSFIQGLINDHQGENLMIILDHPPGSILQFFLGISSHGPNYGEGLMITEYGKIKIPIPCSVTPPSL